MKILRAIYSVAPAAGGPVEVIRQFSAACDDDVEVLSLDPPDAPYVAQFPLVVHSFGAGVGKYGYNPSLLRWLKAHAAHFDAVVIDGVWQYHSFAVWRVLRRSSTPYVVFTHGMLDPWFKRQYPLKHLKKLPYWLAFERRVLRDAAAVIYTCEEERILARQSFPCYRASERIVHLGTSPPAEDSELQRRSFLARFPELRNKRIALFLGRLHPKKGCDLVIEAFATALASDPEWRLVMAGPDQVGWQEELEELAARLGIAQRITWTGMLEDAEKWGAYRASEIFVLPSHQENFGIVVAEALACGLPLLLSNKVNIWREVEEAGAGLIAPDDLASVVALLNRWTAMEVSERALMRRAALNCFRSRFDVGMVSHSFTELLMSLLPATAKQSVHA